MVEWKDLPEYLLRELKAEGLFRACWENERWVNRVWSGDRMCLRLQNARLPLKTPRFGKDYAERADLTVTLSQSALEVRVTNPDPDDVRHPDWEPGGAWRELEKLEFAYKDGWDERDLVEMLRCMMSWLNQKPGFCTLDETLERCAADWNKRHGQKAEPTDDGAERGRIPEPEASEDLAAYLMRVLRDDGLIDAYQLRGFSDRVYLHLRARADLPRTRRPLFGRETIDEVYATVYHLGDGEKTDICIGDPGHEDIVHPNWSKYGRWLDPEAQEFVYRNGRERELAELLRRMIGSLNWRPGCWSLDEGCNREAVIWYRLHGHAPAGQDAGMIEWRDLPLYLQQRLRDAGLCHAEWEIEGVRMRLRVYAHLPKAQSLFVQRYVDEAILSIMFAPPLLAVKLERPGADDVMHPNWDENGYWRDPRVQGFAYRHERREELDALVELLRRMLGGLHLDPGCYSLDGAVNRSAADWCRSHGCDPTGNSVAREALPGYLVRQLALEGLASAYWQETSDKEKPLVLRVRAPLFQERTNLPEQPVMERIEFDMVDVCVRNLTAGRIPSFQISQNGFTKVQHPNWDSNGCWRESKAQRFVYRNDRQLMEMLRYMIRGLNLQPGFYSLEEAVNLEAVDFYRGMGYIPPIPDAEPDVKDEKPDVREEPIPSEPPEPPQVPQSAAREELLTMHARLLILRTGQLDIVVKFPDSCPLCMSGRTHISEIEREGQWWWRCGACGNEWDPVGRD